MVSSSDKLGEDRLSRFCVILLQGRRINRQKQNLLGEVMKAFLLQTLLQWYLVYWRCPLLVICFMITYHCVISTVCVCKQHLVSV